MIRLLNKVLVIDEMPIICLGLQEAFRVVNKEVTVESAENLFSVLSSPAYDEKSYDLIIASPPNDGYAEEILQPIADLHKKFPESKILLFAESYDPTIIEKMKPLGIDAYVHKYEGIHEIREAYGKLSENESYVSAIFHTIYFKYGLNPAFLQQRKDLLISISASQRDILLLLCQGKTMQEIADLLQRPAAEIMTQVNHFGAKL